MIIMMMPVVIAMTMEIPIVVIAEIGSSSGAAVADVVHSLSGFEIPLYDYDRDDDQGCEGVLMMMTMVIFSI